MDTDEFNLSAIAQHLQKSPFAAVFDKSNEKGDPIALKLMCIVDFEMQRNVFYSRMQEASPKLLTQLMQFHSFGTFKYYDYQVGSEIGKRLLKCKFCDLTASYGLILTHMAINHNAHIGLKKCVYCNRFDMKRHFADDSMEQCYANYLQRNDIEPNKGTIKVYNIVADFYDMLKELSVKFAINTYRNYGFTGKGHQAVARLNHGYDSDIDEKIMVFNNRTPKMATKNISGRLNALDREFQRVIGILYGGNNVSRMVRQQTDNANGNGNGGNAIIISDDDSDNEDDGRSRATNSSQSSISEPVASTSAADAIHKPLKTQLRRTFANEPVAINPAIVKMESEVDYYFETSSEPSTSTIPTVKMVRDELSAKMTTATTTTTTTTATQAAIPNATASVEGKKSDVEQFGQYVVQRLFRQTDDRKRRKMESVIQQTIAKIEMELLE